MRIRGMKNKASRPMVAAQALGESGILRTSRITGYEGIDQAALHERFRSFQESGVIAKGCSYEDPVWKLDGETALLSFRFPADREAFDAGAGTWCGCSLEEFTSATKAAILLQMGSLSLTLLRQQLHEVSVLVRSTAEEAAAMDASPSLVQILSLLPGEGSVRGAVMESMESGYSQKAGIRGAQRVLESFEAFLRFAKDLEDIWKHLTPAEKVRWFLIWLWWNLTCILPLRPTELLVTPWDCVHRRDGGYTLTIRRTRLKKRPGTLTYRVVTDYYEETYSIPDPLAEEIIWYQQAVMGERTQEMGQETAGDKEGSDELAYLFGGDRPLPYATARRMLKDFTTDVLGWETAPIHLGDTRHLAMISLILSGGNPEICRALAGHESVAIASHYYSNISTLTELAAMAITKYMRGRAYSAGESPFRLVPGDVSIHQVPGGGCDEEAVLTGDIRECLKNSHHGQLCGDCTGCPHFYPDREHARQVLIQCRERVDADSTFLMDAINQARKGIGKQEDLEVVLTRLQSSCRRYAGLMTRTDTAGEMMEERRMKSKTAAQSRKGKQQKQKEVKA